MPPIMVARRLRTRGLTRARSSLRSLTTGVTSLLGGLRAMMLLLIGLHPELSEKRPNPRVVPAALVPMGQGTRTIPGAGILSPALIPIRIMAVARILEHPRTTAGSHLVRPDIAEVRIPVRQLRPSIRKRIEIRGGAHWADEKAKLCF